MNELCSVVESDVGFGENGAQTQDEHCERGGCEGLDCRRGDRIKWKGGREGRRYADIWGKNFPGTEMARAKA